MLNYLVVCLEKESFRCERKVYISSEKANLNVLSSEGKTQSPKEEWGEK